MKVNLTETLSNRDKGNRAVNNKTRAAELGVPVITQPTQTAVTKICGRCGKEVQGKVNCESSNCPL
jgi:hypothetical protein